MIAQEGVAPVELTLRDYLEGDLRRNFRLEVSEDVEPTSAQMWGRLLSPRFAPVLLVRLAQSSSRAHLGFFAKVFAAMNVSLFGIEVSPKCEIGPGLYLPHTVGTVIGARRIGPNAMIFQGVTLGSKVLDIRFDPALRPELGANVTVGAGAKVLGGITLADGATVGANSVVTRDVMVGQTVAGIPARATSG